MNTGRWQIKFNQHKGLWYYEVVRYSVPPETGYFAVYGSAKKKRIAKRQAEQLARDMEERFPS